MAPLTDGLSIQAERESGCSDAVQAIRPSRAGISARADMSASALRRSFELRGQGATRTVPATAAQVFVGDEAGQLWAFDAATGAAAPKTRPRRPPLIPNSTPGSPPAAAS